MKFKIEAGGEIDLLTRDELREEMRGWMDEFRRGPKVRKFSAQAQAAGSVYTIDGQDGNQPLGPAEGFAWSVYYVAFGGSGYTQGTDLSSIFIGDRSATRLVASGITRHHVMGKLLLVGGDRLSFSGAATAAAGAGIVVVSGQAVEVPEPFLQMLI